jgi:hypothetical protein
MVTMKKPFCQLSVLVVTKTNVMTNKPNITISDPITRLCNEILTKKTILMVIRQQNAFLPVGQGRVQN